jgi:hypothetical protein
MAGSEYAVEGRRKGAKAGGLHRHFLSTFAAAAGENRTWDFDYANPLEARTFRPPVLYR